MRFQKYLQSLRQLGELMRTTSSLQELVGITLRELLNLFEQVELGGIFLLDTVSSQLSLGDCRCRQAGPVVPIFNHAVLRSVEETRRTVRMVLPDAEGTDEIAAARPLRTHVCAPLMVRDELVGAIYVASSPREAQDQTGAKEFDEKDMSLLTSLSNLVALSVKNAALAEQLQQSIRMCSSLQRYVSTDVAELIANGGFIKPRVIDAVVMFCDVVGFSSLAERLDPQQTAGLLNRIYTHVAPLVFAHGGVIDKYVGDGLLAVWETRASNDSSMRAALQAALEMHNTVFWLSHRYQSHSLPELQFTIGITRGRMRAGDIGSDERLDFTVIGDTVNMAARIQGMAHAGQTLTTIDSLDTFASQVISFGYGNQAIRGRQKTAHIASLCAVPLKSSRSRRRWLTSIPVQVGPDRMPGRMISVTVGPSIDADVMCVGTAPPSRRGSLWISMAERTAPLRQPGSFRLISQTGDIQLLRFRIAGPPTDLVDLFVQPGKTWDAETALATPGLRSAATNQPTRYGVTVHGISHTQSED
jgi:class 3 adenylate cyclase